MKRPAPKYTPFNKKPKTEMEIKDAEIETRIAEIKQQEAQRRKDMLVQEKLQAQEKLESDLRATTEAMETLKRIEREIAEEDSVSTTPIECPPKIKMYFVHMEETKKDLATIEKLFDLDWSLPPHQAGKGYAHLYMLEVGLPLLFQEEMIPAPEFIDVSSANSRNLSYDETTSSYGSIVPDNIFFLWDSNGKGAQYYRAVAQFNRWKILDVNPSHTWDILPQSKENWIKEFSNLRMHDFTGVRWFLDTDVSGYNSMLAELIITKSGGIVVDGEFCDFVVCMNPLPESQYDSTRTQDMASITEKIAKQTKPITKQIEKITKQKKQLEKQKVVGKKQKKELEKQKEELERQKEELKKQKKETILVKPEFVFQVAFKTLVSSISTNAFAIERGLPTVSAEKVKVHQMVSISNEMNQDTALKTILPQKTVQVNDLIYLEQDYNEIVNSEITGKVYFVGNPYYVGDSQTSASKLPLRELVRSAIYTETIACQNWILNHPEMKLTENPIYSMFQPILPSESYWNKTIGGINPKKEVVFADGTSRHVSTPDGEKINRILAILITWQDSLELVMKDQDYIWLLEICTLVAGQHWKGTDLVIFPSEIVSVKRRKDKVIPVSMSRFQAVRNIICWISTKLDASMFAAHFNPTMSIAFVAQVFFPLRSQALINNASVLFAESKLAELSPHNDTKDIINTMRSRFETLSGLMQSHGIMRSKFKSDSWPSLTIEHVKNLAWDFCLKLIALRIHVEKSGSIEERAKYESLAIDIEEQGCTIKAGAMLFQFNMKYMFTVFVGHASRGSTGTGIIDSEGKE